MNRQLILVSCRIAILAIVSAAISLGSRIYAAPVFYLSNSDSGNPPAGLLSLTGIAPGSVGTLHIWSNSDVRLSGVSLDLVETGGGIKFTGLDVNNPAGPPQRWVFLDGPLVVTDSSITNIGGAAVPGLSGDGVGAGSTAGTSVLLASVPYMATGGGTINLQMRIGSNGIADWDGNFTQVRFGSPTAALINGDAFGMGGSVGSIQIGDPIPPVAMDVNLGDREQGSIISHTFTTSVGVPPITWGNLIASGPGSLVNAPSLTANGVFNWNSAGSPLGQYNFDVTATNGFGSDVGRLSLNLVAPPPEPPTVVDFAVIANPGDTILHTFQTSAGDTPITWSNLVSVGPGTPAILPQLTADGLFSWNSTGSLGETYEFRVTATNQFGSDIGELAISLGGEPLIPEPATATLLGLALAVGGAGTVRRRG